MWALQRARRGCLAWRPRQGSTLSPSCQPLHRCRRHLASASDTPSDVTIVGGGAAGLTAAFFAAEAGVRVTVLERTREAGKKVLMSGGTRCNVLPLEVDPSRDFFSDSPASAVRAVLASWPLPAIRSWLEHDVDLELVEEEETAKVFPASQSSREVRDKLVAACVERGVRFQYGASVEALRQEGGSGANGDSGVWECALASGAVHTTRRLVLCTGGLSFPAVGTDGTGHRLLADLGVPLVPPYPALTPLKGAHPGGAQLAGLSLYNVDMRVVQDPAGAQTGGGRGRKKPKPIRATRTGLLFTHRGYSGPAVLDVSHHFTKALAGGGGAGGPGLPGMLTVNWTGEGDDEWDARLRAGGTALVANALQRAGLRERLADALCAELGLGARRMCELTRTERAALITRLTAYALPVSGSEGYKKAEVTGGGVPLTQVCTKTLECKALPGLHLAGELLDVFGRIGGFNFVWAWVTGRLAGRGAAVAALAAAGRGGGDGAGD